MHRYLTLVILIILIKSCDKDNNIIPNVKVDFRIQASELSGVGSAIYTQENYGVRGIIIYHKNTNEYVAFERACSYRPNDNCAVVHLNNEVNPSFLTDSCCNSSFLLEDGTPFSGPALLPLKQYSTNFDGTYIYVYN